MFMVDILSSLAGTYGFHKFRVNACSSTNEESPAFLPSADAVPNLFLGRRMGVD
jgi:hypothetical protein